MADNVRATPQNPYTGKLASALRRMQQLAGQYQVDPRVPLLGGTSVDELLSLPGAASLMEDVSYNGPRALIRGGNAATGGIGTFRLDPRILDTAEFVSNVSPLAMLAGRGAARGARAAGRAGERLAERMVPGVMERGGLGAAALQALSSGTTSNVVKPKGGNWLAGSVEEALGPLKKRLDPELEGYARRGQNLMPHEAAEVLPGVALNDWIDKQLTRYVKNEMATPEDPIRALAERGVLHFEPQNVFLPSDTAHARTAAGFPRHGMGKSQLATDWEVLSDKFIVPNQARDFLRSYNEQTGVKTVESNPWLQKVPPETIVYDQAYRANPSGLGFTHLIDELRNATNPASGLPPELLLKYSSLPQVSVPQAVQRVSDINKWRAAQKAEADLARANNAATVLHKDYPDKGFRWVELKMPEKTGKTVQISKPAANLDEEMDMIEEIGRPDFLGGAGDEAVYNARVQSEIAGRSGDEAEKLLRDALKYEGDTMGHCVGGYCPDVLEGRSRIFSLRSAKGEPHVTVEVKPSAGPSQAEAVAQARAEGLRGQAFAERVVDLMEGKDLPPQIVQIKGKANRAPNPEYLPYVQDFVKSGQWSDVGDLQNTGLLKFGDKYIDKAKYKSVAGDLNPDYFDALLRNKAADLSADDARILQQLQEPGFAQGGLVQYDPAKIDALTQQLQEELHAA